MIRNPRTGFTIPEHGQKRPPKPGSASSSRKGLFVLLAISALATASQAFAQHRNGSADGLYAVPDAGASASTVPESASKRATESYLSSLDSQGDRFQRDLEKAEAERKAASAKRPRDLAAAGSSGGPVWTLSPSQRLWIPIWAGVGLLVSLLAVGYVWWSRTRYSRINRAVLLAVKREPAAGPDLAEKQDQPSTRRAA